MEESRLKPMVKGYDVNVFNDLYVQTEKLRRKLASEIDPRRFGVDYFEILSWFDVKFIYVFNRYYEKHSPDILKGHIIRGLQFFKCRILRKAYTQSSIQHMNTTELTDYEDFEHEDFLEETEHTSDKDFLYDLAMEFFKSHLSENAYELLQVQLNPPPYIIHLLQEEGIENRNKIPNSIFADYFELGTSPKAIKYIESLKKEIKGAIEEARRHFKMQGQSLRHSPSI